MIEQSYISRLSTLYNLDFSTFNISLFGAGHIHQTWLANRETQSYIIQKFNKNVFKNPGLIAHNHQLLIDHLDFEALDFDFPLPIPNVKGRTLCLVGDEYFRVLPFIEGVCLQEIEQPKQAFLAASAFASLIQVAVPLDVNLFQEVIPGFHDLELRFSQFIEAREYTRLKISGELAAICEFYLQQSGIVKEYQMWISLLPKRITHNDTKINNLIFSADLTKVEAIIDLDTMMPGYAFNDFGDLVRTVSCNLDENSLDFDSLKVNVDKYQALYEGFLEGSRDTLTKDEIASLHFGGGMMIYIMGLRFLTDYLNGNIYYQIKYENQNYDRAKNQMYLLKSLQQLGFNKQ
ncbi:Phosphotransferase enzyme family protein [Belliella buryatensis]|uniref:Phosphotransferase enzyme family protein n=1 Tax=Belliella buryatensis TaxID=1500549 RepID=A0A239DGL7_9BACT|nr:phosphotransferase [Belliella buryatensis]SNS31656.1 Phosphotransferase enzyme family protein [Belliella buryatensis]